MPRRDGTEVTFVLPREDPPGPVSVVGDFNDWQPGVRMPQPRKDGERAATVALPADGVNEESGDHDGPNSRLRT
ncbi:MULTISPECIES: hypothetical protein [unclassified Streptomyces]|uniref:hypothetical protein n=1 Tax=unclassified Streptomyces TaxID=2593676 RepID=UPI00332028A5